MCEAGEKMIQQLPKQSTIIYTDGSSLKSGKSGSGVHIIAPGQVTNASRRNTDGSSNFTAEMQAILIALQEVNAAKTVPTAVHIISDCKSALQSITKCHTSPNHLVRKIAMEIDHLPNQTELSLQWVPSHVGIHGNEIADGLAKQGTEKKMPEDEDQVPLSVEDHKAAMTRWAMKAWRSDQKHEWYAATKPGSTISQDLNREEQTTISRLKSGHLRTMTFQNGHSATRAKHHHFTSYSAST
jgi:ribonuclease HI